MALKFLNNATFAGAVSTGGYLTLNSSDSVPRLIFNGSGDDFFFSNTASYFGLYNSTDSRWDIKVDGAGDTTFAGAVTVEGGILHLGKADTASGHINAKELMTFNIDTDNDDTNRYFAWYTNSSSGSGTELLKILETGAATFSGDVTTDGIFKVDTAPDDNILEVTQSGRKMALKTSFAGDTVGSFWAFRVSNGNVNGGTTDALIVRPQNATFAGSISAVGLNLSSATGPIITLTDTDASIGVDSIIGHIAFVGTEIGSETSRIASVSETAGGEAGLRFYTGASVTQALQLDKDQNATFAGDVSLADSKKLILGAGSDLQIYHNNSNDRGYIYNGTGDLYIENDATDGDIKFYSDDGSGGTALYFRIDGGAVETRFLKSTLHFDNVKAKFGDSGDLQIYHDGSHSYIEDVGTGDLTIRASNDLRLQSAATEAYLTCNENGSVQIYYNNVEKFATTSGGIQVTGEIRTTDYIVHTGDSDTYFGFPTDNEFKLVVGGTNKFAADTNAAYMYYQGNVKLQTTSAGATITGNLDIGGDIKINNTTPYLYNNDDEILVGSDAGGYYFGLVGSGNSTKPLFIGDHNSYIRFDTDGDEAMRIKSNGDVRFNSNSHTPYIQLVNSGRTPGNPGYSFNNDENTGMFQPAGVADTIAFSTAGAERIRINSSGNVGIGTTSPSTKLDVRLSGTTGKVAELHNSVGYGIGFTVESDGGVNTINSESNQALAFATNGSSNERMRISSAGAIKFNTYTAGTLVSDASGNITVSSGGGAGGPYLPLAGGTMTGNTKHNDNVFSYWGNNDDLAIRHNATDTYIENYTGDLQIVNYADDSDIVFKSDNGSGGTTEYFRLDGGSTMNVFSKPTWHGDGVKSFFGNSQDLQIYHDGSHSRIADVGTGHLVINATDFVVNNSADTKNMIIATDGGSVNLYYNALQKFRTTSAGVEVTGNIDLPNNGAILFDNTNNTEQYYIRNGGGSQSSFQVGKGNPGSDIKLVISDGGNVGIGTTSPSYKLDVNGGIQAGGKVTYTKQAGSLDTTGYAVAGITALPAGNGFSCGFTFTCFGGAGKYQKLVYSCYNSAGTWNAKKVIDEGTNDLDIVASANGATITFTFKARSSTQSFTPRVTVEAVGISINSTYA